MPAVNFLSSQPFSLRENGEISLKEKGWGEGKT
jgi:hypothetical protein